jgi:hypothetical protein
MDALFLTSQRLLTEHWPTVARVIAPVLGAVRGDFTVHDLEEMCRDGRAVAGLAFQDGEPAMAFVWELRLYPSATRVNIIALAGRDLQEATSTFWPRFVEWCRESGITEIEACALPAMTRMLQPLGFSHTYNLVRMPTGAAT